MPTATTNWESTRGQREAFIQAWRERRARFFAYLRWRIERCQREAASSDRKVA